MCMCVCVCLEPVAGVTQRRDHKANCRRSETILHRETRVARRRRRTYLGMYCTVVYVVGGAPGGRFVV